jgi:hypothetical protein
MRIGIVLILPMITRIGKLQCCKSVQAGGLVHWVLAIDKTIEAAV